MFLKKKNTKWVRNQLTMQATTVHNIKQSLIKFWRGSKIDRISSRKFRNWENQSVIISLLMNSYKIQSKIKFKIMIPPLTSKFNLSKTRLKLRVNHNTNSSLYKSLQLILNWKILRRKTLQDNKSSKKISANVNSYSKMLKRRSSKKWQQNRKRGPKRCIQDLPILISLKITFSSSRSNVGCVSWRITISLWKFKQYMVQVQLLLSSLLQFQPKIKG